MTLRPIAEQDPLESRRAWEKVQAAINKGDLETTSAEKNRIEVEQREMRKKEKEEGREWERRYFKQVEEDPVFARLAAKQGLVPEADKTNGIWLFDEEKYRKIRGETATA